MTEPVKVGGVSLEDVRWWHHEVESILGFTVPSHSWCRCSDYLYVFFGQILSGHAGRRVSGMIWIGQMMISRVRCGPEFEMLDEFVRFYSAQISVTVRIGVDRLFTAGNFSSIIWLPLHFLLRISQISQYITLNVLLLELQLITTIKRSQLKRGPYQNIYQILHA